MIPFRILLLAVASAFAFASGCLAAEEALVVVRTAGLSPAEQALLSGLQGLLNRTDAAVWIQSGGINARVLRDLRSEGRAIEEVDGPWPLVRRFRDRVAGIVVGSVADESLNRATSVAAVTNALVVDVSLLERPELAGLPILEDTRRLTDAELWSRYSARFTRGLAVHQAPKKTLHLRDLAVAMGLHTFHDVEPAERSRRVRELGPGTRVFGWGEDELRFVREVSEGGGAVLPADWSLNLSALRHLPIPGPTPRPVPPAEPAPLRDGERVVAFVVTDGDNLQWVGGGFVDSPGFWASTNRGRFPVTWEMAPSLLEFAPRVVAHLRATATPKDDFVCGPSGFGYQFPNRLPAGLRADAAARTERAARESGWPLVTVLDDGGAPDRVAEWLGRPGIEGVLHKDYAPYNGHHGAVAWRNGKASVGYRFLLWESGGRNGRNRPEWLPEGVAEAVGRMPSDATAGEGRFALVNVHAWSFRDSGGPMGAVARTIPLLPPGTRVVTATDFFRLLRADSRARPSAPGDTRDR